MLSEDIPLEDVIAEQQQLIEPRSYSLNAISRESQELLNDVLNNNKEEIQNRISQCTDDEVLNVKFEEYGGKSILLIASDNDDVSAETLSTLLSAIKSKFGEFSCVDESRSGWESIHYIAKNADPTKLQVLVDLVDDLNCLTYFSENALHVLLQYNNLNNPFEVNLYDGEESRCCTIISTEEENVVECAKILIFNGIDINHSNFWNETPICLAIRYRYAKVIEELLRTNYVDLDNYSEGGLMIRNYLKRSNMFSNILPLFYAIENHVTVLFDLLKNGDESKFVHYADGKISLYANEDDGSVTMLQFCLRKGFLYYLQEECYQEDYNENDIRSSPLLTIFCKKGLGRCIEHLLDNGADPSKTTKKFKESLLEYAARRGYYPFVAILLDHKDCRIGHDEIFETLKKLSEHTLDLRNITFYRKCVLYLMINKLIVSFDKTKLTNQKLNTLNNILYELDLEADKNSIDTELICMLLRLGARLTKAGNKGMVIELLHPTTLKAHIDDCFDNNTFYYDSIIQDGDNVYSETTTISHLANSNHKTVLLVHPVFTYFIRKKWSKIAWFFYLDLMFYFLFLVSISVYMICVHTSNESSFVNYFFYFLWGIECLKESFQLVFLYRRKYFKDPSNILELVVIISSLVVFIIPNVYSMVLAILFATGILFLMLGQLPDFTKYTIIFGSAKYFLQYTGFYFIQFLSFSICFYIIFPFEENVSSPRNEINPNNTGRNSTDVTDLTADLFKSLFFTLIYFTGEFSDRVLEPSNYPVFGRVMMTFFIFCMTIILNNLLVGLIVADMDDIQKRGKLYKQVKIATFIRRTDTFIKRIHDFKSHRFIKNIIRGLNVFKKGEKPKCFNLGRDYSFNWSEEDWQYLKSIKDTNQHIYDKNILREIHDTIRKNNLTISE